MKMIKWRLWNTVHAYANPPNAEVRGSNSLECAKCKDQRSTDNQSIVFFLVNWIGLYSFIYTGNFVHQKNDNNTPPAEIYFETFKLFSDLIFFRAALRCKRRSSFTVEDGRC